MSKLKFVLPIATILGIAFLLSCTNVEDAVQQAQQAQCALTQGEWNEDAKKCEKCPEGTSMSDGQCVAPSANVIVREDGTIVCPAKTKPNDSGVCVADIIAIDPDAVASKYYCDYGELDPLAEKIGGGCVEIEYESECDKDFGKLVSSCNDGDRRKDQLKYCDYGPVDQYGGGCYLVLDNGNDCNKEYGIVANKCGTHGKYPDGTVCPAGKTKRKVGNINECQVGDAGITDGTATHCDWGTPHIEDGEMKGGCWAMDDSETRNNCLLWGKGVKTCPNYSCPSGATKVNGGGNSGCQLANTVGGNSSSSQPTPSSSSQQKYCFFGSNGCYPISPSDTITTEARCENDYGMVVASCSNVTWQFCDWGQPVIKNDGSVEKGCWAIRTTKDRTDCQLYGTPSGGYGIVNTCSNNYACPAGTTKYDNDDGWNQVGCVLANTAGGDNSLYCDFGPRHSSAPQEDEYGGCWQIENESECDQYGKLVNSCNPSDRRTDMDFCDYGMWGTYIDDAGKIQIGGGCYSMWDAEARSSCEQSVAAGWAKIVKKCTWLN